MRRLDRDIPELVAQMAAGTGGAVAIAVSGGSDSLGLLYLADLWAREAGRPLLVLTVDHGLRVEAAGEALFVAEKARGLGHACEILTWSPDRSSQDAARKARHGLIARAAHEAGAELVLFGHTRSDIGETLLMRLARPSTLTGAVGPQPVSVSPVWPEGRGLRLARPLAGTYRADLMDWLRARGESWVSDPSNDSPAYERPRLRELAAELGPDRLQRITGDAMRLRALEDLRIAETLERHVSVEDSGLVTLNLEGLAAPGRLRMRLLAILLQAGAGTDRPVAREALEALAGDVAADGPQSRLTLGGAWVQRRGERLLIGRDPGQMQARWQDGIWDGRYVRKAGAQPPADLPFLVRHAVPEGGGWREVISERLGLWTETLRDGARFGAQLAEPPV